MLSFGLSLLSGYRNKSGELAGVSFFPKVSCAIIDLICLPVIDSTIRSLQPAFRSRRFPFASVNRYVLDRARLSHIRVLYNIADYLKLSS